MFVASHHGRESGCCTELFELFRPQLVIISDDGRQYDSQDTDDWYQTRCAGAVFVTNERRYVATTRKDGAMRIDVTADGRWTIERATVRDWPRTATCRLESISLSMSSPGMITLSDQSEIKPLLRSTERCRSSCCRI